MKVRVYISHKHLAKHLCDNQACFRRFVKGGQMGRSDKVSLWCVSLLINTRFRFVILE